MRHADIGTTIKHYVTMDADAIADEVSGKDWECGVSSVSGCDTALLSRYKPADAH